MSKQIHLLYAVIYTDLAKRKSDHDPATSALLQVTLVIYFILLGTWFYIKGILGDNILALENFTNSFKDNKYALIFTALIISWLIAKSCIYQHRNLNPVDKVEKMQPKLKYKYKAFLIFSLFYFFSSAFFLGQT